jgi:ATP-dependent Clp protease protease subunit
MTPTPEWLQGKLFERRLVFVTGRLDAALAAQATAQIVALDAVGDAPIDIVLNISDGTLEAVFALIDVLDAARATVRVQCQGQVSGAAIGVLAAADHRVATLHTSFRLTAPTTELCGRPEQIARQSEQHRHLLWRLQARLAKASGRPPEDVADDMRRGRYLDASEALGYGRSTGSGDGSLAPRL